MDQLIINGVEVDMGDSGVYLEYKSNIMGDISKIESGFSYTIKLPKTAHNLRVFEVVGATTETRVPYTRQGAMLLRDGIPIVRDASVTLRRMAEDSIEVTLSFGAGVGIKKLLSDDKNLNELKYTVGSKEEYVMWERVVNEVFEVADYGFNLQDANAWYHPTVSITSLIDRIADAYGVSIDYSQVGERLSGLRMPLLKRNGVTSDAMEVSFKGVDNNIQDAEEKTGFASAGGLRLTIDNSTDMFSHVGEDSELLLNNINVSFNLNGELEISYIDAQNVLHQRLQIVVYKSAGSIERVIDRVLATVMPYSVTEVDGVKKARFAFNDVVTDYTENGDSLVGFCVERGDNVNMLSITGRCWLKSTYRLNTYAFGQSVKGSQNKEGRFYIVPNLPEIKVVDFLKGVCALVGAYATVEERTIKFMSRDNIRSNGAQEWRRKMIKDGGLSFSVSGVAQKNVFKYKTEDGGGYMSGSFAVNDETLTWEATLVELPFSEVRIGTKNNLSFELYSYSTDGVQSFNEDGNAYVCMSLNDGGMYYLTVDGLKWSQLLERYYQTYIKMVSEAKVKTCKFRLSPLDLMGLDMNKCVYDDGALWAIETIKTKSGDMCDVELIKV